MCGKEKIENCYILISGRRVARGDLVIDGKCIAAIEEHDCKPDKLVMPGLVNCHGHTAMTLLRGLGGGYLAETWQKRGKNEVRPGAWHLMSHLMSLMSA